MTNERAQREAEGDTDRAGQLQSNVMPEFGDNLIGFQIEFCFNYSADDGIVHIWLGLKVLLSQLSTLSKGL